MKYLCNWSGGASSILATKIALANFGSDNCDIIFCETNSHLPFMKDLLLRSQDLYKKEIVVLNSGEKLEDLLLKNGHYNPKFNSYCTRILKQDPIKKYCKENYPDGDYIDVLGYDYSTKECKRAAKFILYKGRGCFPLIELKLDKLKVLRILEQYGFNLKEHYKNETHNNCVPCLKAGKNHWNYVKKYHPEIFEKYKQIELKLKNNGKANWYDKFFFDNKEPRKFETECNGFFCTVNDFGDMITNDYEFVKNYFHGIKAVV
jgi:hypothetical protein